ncbi:hypothetical protein SADUNF_Sadunf01G0178800 [Salix dunnii]|uniref:TF-B3 domain-containing protein n=1 Tax=Salix dunnii TaxID=1413687 RepID=A0A835NCF5_9ROSI|nr:hypothetical protein SADUNF_Sadunf01G0178800 [Salix dunnii]
MEKKLSRTDIQCRLAFWTPSLWVFSMPEGETAVYFEATDTLEQDGENDPYTKPVITGDWLQFVCDKGLKVGDKIFLWMEEGVTGVRYRIRAERKIFRVWVTAAELNKSHEDNAAVITAELKHEDQEDHVTVAESKHQDQESHEYKEPVITVAIHKLHLRGRVEELVTAAELNKSHEDNAAVITAELKHEDQEDHVIVAESKHQDQESRECKEPLNI